MSFFTELQQRNVLRVAAAYIVASWLVIQVVETLFPVFGLSDTAIRTVVIVLAVGLIPVLVLAWAFEITPDGLKLERDVERQGTRSARAGKELDRIIMVILALALGYFAFDKFVLDPARDAELVEETAQAARTDALLESYGDKSIAVLPFVDMSPNSDQEYMSDGIAEELLNLLARIPDLRVVSRSSAFAFKGKDINIPNVAEQLNVAYVLEGSVRQAGDQLRITAQLIEAGTDTHLWSETYDRKLENIFQIQDEISARVVDELKITLLGEVPRSHRIDEQAYKMALQARYFWNRRAEGDAEAAFELYQQALELAPDYAPAWAGISVAYLDRASKGRMPREEGMTLGREAAEKALQLDPKLADAHIRVGQQLGIAGDREGQRQAFKTALSLEPNNSTAMVVMARIYELEGEFEKAIALYQKAELVDPLGALFPATSVGSYVVLGRYEEAENAARRAFELNGNEPMYWGRLSYIYTIQGRYEEVLTVLEPLIGESVEPGALAEYYMQLAVAYHGLGRQEEADEMAGKLDALDDQYELLALASLYALQGDADAAFMWLEKAAKKFPRYYVERHPYFKDIMSDPRWQPTVAQFRSAEEIAQQK